MVLSQTLKSKGSDMRFLILILISAFGLLAQNCKADVIASSPYLAFDNSIPGAGMSISPFSGLDFSYFHLETFEDGLLDTPGVTVNDGLVFSSPSFTDSVDADDGIIDGNGQSGRSFLTVDGLTGLRFDFDQLILGTLPTHVGLVWTDGSTFNDLTFEAFDGNGLSLGTLVELGVGDGDFSGGTAEDLFFGATNQSGISAITITSIASSGSTGIGIEVDHLQYGRIVPEPNSSAIFTLLMSSVVFRRRTRRRT